MTKLRSTVLSAVLTLALPAAPAMAAADGWGASYSFNAISPATNHLISAKTTLVPGRLPPSAPGTGPLFIWPGLSNGKGDLIQTTLDAWGDNKGACGAATGQWCGETSIFGSFGQLSGTSAAFDPDDHITIEYKLGSDNNTWTQTMTSMKLGKVVSTFSRASGPMLAGGFGFATEADQDSYTIDNQYYLCTEFHLAAADPTWGPKSGGGNGAKYGATGTGSGPGTAKNLHTPDGGLTWLVDLITLPAMQPQGTQTPVPTTGTNCSAGGGGSGSGGSSGTGGAPDTGGMAGAGGTKASGGSSATGGSSGATTGGSVGTGGTGGQPAMSGGAANTGGHSNTGGAVAAGGASTGSGGTAVAGGTSASAGNPASGGMAMADGSASDGSCSCRILGKQPARTGVGGGLALLGLSLLGLRRRRRSR